MVPIIENKRDILLRETNIESLMLRVALGYPTSEFRSEQFSGDALLACSGYLGEFVSPDKINSVFKRVPIKGIDYSNNIFRFIGIHLALKPTDYDEIKHKFIRFNIRNKFLTSVFFPNFEESLKVALVDTNDPFSKLLKILYYKDELTDEDERIITDNLLTNGNADEIDIVLYHSLQKKFAKIRYNHLGSVDIIKRIFSNFQDAIKHLTMYRRKDHIKFEIRDEYDVQDLSYFVLRSIFNKLQFENPHFKSGGTNSRVDLMLVDEGIDIELKMIKQSDTDEKKFIEQIKIDINDYSTWSGLKDFIVFIYDPQNKTSNRNNFYELGGPHTINDVTFNVHIIISN